MIPQLLKPGDMYYRVYALNPKMKKPLIDELIYIGKNLQKDRKVLKNYYYFQDAHSYLKYGDYRRMKKKAYILELYEEKQIKYLYNIFPVGMFSYFLSSENCST